MLAVPACQLTHPIEVFVLVTADDGARNRIGRCVGIQSMIPAIALAQFTPIFFVDFYAKFLGRRLDFLPCGITLRVRDAFYLVEACKGISHVTGVFERFLFLRWKCKFLFGKGISFFCAALRHVNSRWTGKRPKWLGQALQTIPIWSRSG